VSHYIAITLYITSLILNSSYEVKEHCSHISMTELYCFHTDKPYADLSVNIKFCSECDIKNLQSALSASFRSDIIEIIDLSGSSSVISRSSPSRSSQASARLHNIESQLAAWFSQLNHCQAETAQQKSFSVLKLFIRWHSLTVNKVMRAHITQSTSATYTFEMHYIIEFCSEHDTEQSVSCKEWTWNSFCMSIFISVWDNWLISFLTRLYSIVSCQCSNWRPEWLHSLMPFVSDNTIHRCICWSALQIIPDQWLKQ